MRFAKRSFKKKRFKYSSGSSFYLQLWFNFHYTFFGSLIFRGKKILAFNTFLKIKNGLKIKEQFDPSLVFLIAMMKISPVIILLPIKNSGMVQGVPFPINKRKQVTFAVRWVIKLLRDNFRVFKTTTIVELLVSSIYNKGLAQQKKKEVYSTSIKNRHLIRYFR